MKEKLTEVPHKICTKVVLVYIILANNAYFIYFVLHFTVPSLVFLLTLKISVMVISCGQNFLGNRLRVALIQTLKTFMMRT